jgi:formylglycine-generating enzyme required for sulfatase activity
VDGFLIDRYAVTNRDFARFVQHTEYVTLAEPTGIRRSTARLGPTRRYRLRSSSSRRSTRSTYQ